MSRAWIVAVALLLSPAAAYAQAVPQAYKANCQMCHQSAAQGVPGVYPRLAGRMDKVAASEDGRRYLIAVLLHGQTGRIMVDGKPLSGAMLPYARLADKDLADILTYISTAGARAKARPFTPAEVAAVRAAPKLPAAKVGEERGRLATAGIVP
ncbi:cytochrome c class I [Sphingomonas sp. MM-1]|uniref:c-type cytochrome n=1 Tax=Sphingomonas sp. MM-1 TaxID=745310 RepID=UPI0002C12F7A|nr:MULTISPECIES: cytochrome c [unclassified Sphingomonas]AGH49186.1 cytochrome c class I [Sphingomonas sp. MM-1]MDX3884331.1 cytochrome c [Sphingomonas sp.]